MKITPSKMSNFQNNEIIEAVLREKRIHFSFIKTTSMKSARIGVEKLVRWETQGCVERYYFRTQEDS